MEGVGVDALGHSGGFIYVGPQRLLLLSSLSVVISYFVMSVMNNAMKAL